MKTLLFAVITLAAGLGTARADSRDYRDARAVPARRAVVERRIEPVRRVEPGHYFTPARHVEVRREGFFHAWSEFSFARFFGCR